MNIRPPCCPKSITFDCNDCPAKSLCADYKKLLEQKYLIKPIFIVIKENENE